MDGETLQPRTTHKGRMNTGHHGAKAEGCQRHFFTCVVLHNMLRTHQGGADWAPNPANDVAALQNEQVVYVPNENYRNPLREAKHQRELLKDYLIMWGHWLGRIGPEICQPSTLGAEAGIYLSFSGLPKYSTKFYLSWCCSNFIQIF